MRNISLFTFHVFIFPPIYGQRNYRNSPIFVKCINHKAHNGIAQKLTKNNQKKS
jgi:hypothetical protein